MSATVDLVIRRGTLVDGSGGEPYLADVAIAGGLISAVGVDLTCRGREEIDAHGLMVTPGFVDIHTHYDGQATWEHRMRPSSAHGVTTAIMGNCGVGFAPCRPDDRDRLVRLIEGVEDLPEPVLTAGLAWNWRSFPDYMDVLASRRFDIDIAAQLPHGPVRVFAMGQRALDLEPANAQDIACMAGIAREAMAAGALGFTTSRTLNHRGSNGGLTPSLKAAEDELSGIALALTEAGAGVLQVVSDVLEPETELPMLQRVVERSGRPLSISLMQVHYAPDRWRIILDWIAAAAAKGLPILGQVCGRPIGRLLGFELSENPFSYCPGFLELAHLSVLDRLAALGDPDRRARIIGETPMDRGEAARDRGLREFETIFPLGDPPNYEPGPQDMIAARAARLGLRPEEVAYDLLSYNGGRGILLAPAVNFVDASLGAAETMMRDDHTLLGLGDGGAHLGLLCDASLPTYMLSHWVRDRTRGDRLPLAWTIKALTQDTARAVRLFDRGRIAPGYKADINIIDFDRLALHPPEVVYDLPAGGRRVTQRAEGYVATLVSGVTVYRDGQPTGELPGQLVRGAQRAPS